jgi:hypothetical protein
MDSLRFKAGRSLRFFIIKRAGLTRFCFAARRAIPGIAFYKKIAPRGKLAARRFFSLFCFPARCMFKRLRGLLEVSGITGHGGLHLALPFSAGKGARIPCGRNRRNSDGPCPFH